MSANHLPSYGAVLQELCDLVGLSQERLAEKAGLTKNTIYNLQHDRTRPQQDSHDKIKEALKPLLQKHLGDEASAVALQRLDDAFDAAHAYGREGLQPPGHNPLWKRRLPVIRLPVWAAIAIAVLALVVLLPVAAVATGVGIPLLGRGGAPAGTAPERPVIGGWFVGVEQRGNSSVLVTIDPRTESRQQLLPIEGATVQIFGRAAALLASQSLIMPAYSPVARTLAMIALAPDGTRSIWLTPLSVSRASQPYVVPPGPRQFVADCGPQCNTLAWSSSGKWVIYNGTTGLIAVDSQTSEQSEITQGPHDAWPACSPDGHWLAYQHAVEGPGYPVVVPAEDCLPTPQALASLRLVNGYTSGWHPAWSADSQFLAFIGSPGGSGQQAWRVFVVALNQMPLADSGVEAAAARPLSPQGCSEPVWVTQARAPKNLVVYVCAPTQDLFVSPGESQPWWQVPLGPSGTVWPVLYNPLWITSP